MNQDLKLLILTEKKLKSSRKMILKQLPDFLVKVKEVRKKEKNLNKS